MSFCKVLKINARLKKFKFYVKKFLYLFVGLENCTTFALAFGKQRGNAGRRSKMILETIPYRQAVQRSLFEKLNEEESVK